MKRIQYLLLFFCCLSFFCVEGQEWERVFSRGVYSQATGVFQTSTGNYLVRGIDVNPDILESEDYIRMFNLEGDILWEKFGVNITFFENNVFEFENGDFLLKSTLNIEINGENYTKSRLLRIDRFGNTLWDFLFKETIEENSYIHTVLLNEDEEIIFFDTEGQNFMTLTTMDQSGNVLISVETQVPLADNYKISLKDNNYIFARTNHIDDQNSLSIYKTNLLGSLISTISLNDLYTGPEGYLLPLENGDYIIVHYTTVGQYLSEQIYVDVLNQTIDVSTIVENSNPQIGLSTFEVLENEIIHAHYNVSTSSIFLMKTDFDGNVLWTKKHEHLPADVLPLDIVPTSDGGYIIAGEYETFESFNVRSYLVKTDSVGNIYENIINGKVAFDSSGNCEIETDEMRLENWIVTATKDSITFISTTNIFGNYSIPADTGTYVISIERPSEYWGLCQDDIEVDFTTIDTSATIDISVNKVVECPNMAVGHTVPSIRPCFERPSYVNYCNYGTVSADSVYIEITYDSLITPVSSSIPFDSLGDQIYRFNIGMVDPLECGSFTVDLFLDCDATVGAAYCIDTHIYPDSICLTPSTSWSGAFVEVSAACEADSIYFRIENTGSGNMDQSSDYIIVEDVILRESGIVQLNSGEFDTIPYPANGSTYSIIAEQVPEAPGFSVPVAVIEGCGENDDGEFSIGFSNQFPLNDGDPFLDLDCPIAISAFDPNDKQGFPEGYGAEHFIRPETPIEYLIRFQNTGTDTAFTVIVRDTLDSQLDFSTFQRGASSHDYDFSINAEGGLIFNFQNIMLPDSNVNEIASHGFVEFKIAPRSDLSLGSVIRNTAAIYFDFEDPIFTNETFHTLGEEFIEIEVGVVEHPRLDNISVIVKPNPFNNVAEIEIINHSSESYLMELFDIRGHLIRQERYNTAPISFYKKELTPGIYFYRLSAKDGFYSAGKVVVY